MRIANYQVVREASQFVLLKDVGPWDRFLSITNAAELVVAEMAPRLNGRRLVYYDTDGELTELLYAGNEFRGFAVPEDIRL